MKKSPIQHAYVSGIDQLMIRFDQKHRETLSQKEEKQEAKKIAKMRDDVVSSSEKKTMWEGF